MVPTSVKVFVTGLVFFVSFVLSFISARRKKREKMAAYRRSEPDFDF